MMSVSPSLRYLNSQSLVGSTIWGGYGVNLSGGKALLEEVLSLDTGFAGF